MKIFNQKQLTEISNEINQGEVVAIPTDTVYGLACKFNNDKAIAKIYQIKKRDDSKPLPILVGSWEQAKTVGVISNKLQSYLTSNFLLGKVTVIVAKQSILNTKYWSQQDLVAIRVSVSPFVQQLTKIVGPLVATSCNLSNELPIKNAADINFPDLKCKVIGEILVNKPSTIYNSFNGKIIRQ